ncbi:MAG TPA: sulfatase-like hydrolase/transferase, partial [Actinomycetota bacterium]|nr:sulfatase-like hydrolase/transferase [Actinomycetota bacterium]
MQRVRLVLLAICWVAVVAVGVYVAEPASSQDDRPNVLVIVTDDQRERDQMLVMPKTLEIFGEEGTRFTHAFATTPQCCPSRASIFTG